MDTDKTRRLDFLVPMYDEGEEVVKPLLDSIALQAGVDLSQVGVIICCDGGKAKVSKRLRDSYPFEVEFHRMPHRGVSATRNACLDKSGAEYVMWCDADDRMLDARGLFIIFREMDAPPAPQDVASYGATGTGFDYLVSVFCEESKTPEGELTYLNHDMDFTFVHGKVCRRQWLIDNKVRFCDRLTVHEDSYMQLLCREVAKPWRVKYCPMPWYLWCWRDASVCRHDPDYILKTFPNMIESCDALIDEFVRRMMPDKANAHTASLVWETYYMLNKPEWVEKTHEDYRDITERRFAEFFRKHREKWDALTSQEKVIISNGVRQRKVMEGMLMEAVTVDQWLERVLEKFPEDSE